MRSILVTGGAGFVGAQLVRDLLADGAHVVVYDNWANASPERLPTDDPRLEVVEGDIRDEERFRATVSRSRPEVVVHLAAIHFIPYCNTYPEVCWEVNTLGTLRVLHAARGSSVRRVVLASTAAVYPVQDEPCHEEGPVGPIDVYGASKQACEALGATLAVEAGVSVAAARLFNVFGPGETNPHVIPEVLNQVRSGEPLRVGNLEARRDYVHVRDVSRALRAMADAAPDGFSVCNVGTGQAWSVADVVRFLGEELGRTLDVGCDESRMRRVDRPVLLADCSRAAARYGWKPEVGFRDGLVELLDEYLTLRR